MVQFERSQHTLSKSTTKFDPNDVDVGGIKEDVEAISAWYFAPGWAKAGFHTLSPWLQTDAAHCRCGSLLLRTYAQDANRHQVLVFATCIEDTETQGAWEEHFANMQADEAYGTNMNDEENVMLIDMNPGEVAALREELPNCPIFYCCKHRGANCGNRVREYEKLVFTTRKKKLKQRLKAIDETEPKFSAWLRRVALQEQFPAAFHSKHQRPIGAITTQVSKFPVSNLTMTLTTPTKNL